ncbi:1,4-alpha-glucan branching protein [Blastococcus sp. TF02A-26]|uniref:maltokinase N-terminal cap-like domain-containing protein n=1 Tax=Blastococcus sp. TF02A-26 TaxID=2250577 RepID=UPI000DEBB8BD|nr:1,4-alpha-glucan branching protein [Blastococcus sp. TF02A-26]RBY85193.1 1,4-alpha-glucan branching protein [Blastococcus sp. TF02A-26]
MATIHDTTLVPGKLDLLSDWLPRQPWYRAHGNPPALVRSGGFRLDDPAGEVGVEVLFVTDTAGASTYAVPLTYRGAPLDDDGALVGTSQHGVLGPRWFYDGARDPVAMTQLRELATGRVVAAHQTRSDTVDPTVTGSWSGPGEPAEVEVVRVLDPQEPTGAGTPPGEVTADVALPDGSRVRRRVAVVR